MALGAYQISGHHAYVYIVYLESAPHSNPTITIEAERKYYGVGAAMIAFGIKYSIDHGCRGDVVFEAKNGCTSQALCGGFSRASNSGRVSGRVEKVYAGR